MFTFNPERGMIVNLDGHNHEIVWVGNNYSTFRARRFKDNREINQFKNPIYKMANRSTLPKRTDFDTKQYSFTTFYGDDIKVVQQEQVL